MENNNDYWKNITVKGNYCQTTNGMTDRQLFSKDDDMECHLLDAVARVAQKNKIGVNELSYLFPAILRMLRSDINWSK